MHSHRMIADARDGLDPKILAADHFDFRPPSLGVRDDLTPATSDGTISVRFDINAYQIDTMMLWAARSLAFDGPAEPAAGIDVRADAGPARAVETTVDTSGLSASDFTGAGQNIVVIDDGYSPFFDQSNALFGIDFSGNNDPEAGEFTFNSHGSWVAQTATNVAEDAGIIYLKVFADGSESAELRDIEEALAWVENYGRFFDVAAVNMSLGLGNATEETLSIFSDEIAGLDEQGIFTVVAAGNSADKYPEGVNIIAADPNAVGVSASDVDGGPADFSQTDPELTDIFAPGTEVEIETAWGATFAVEGTSFSAPYVSGTAARLQQASEELLGFKLTDEQFIQILQASAIPVTGAGPDAPDGYAVADADAAVDYFIDNLDLYTPTYYEPPIASFIG